MQSLLVRFLFILVFSVSACLCGLAIAAEPDNFTRRAEYLKKQDATPVIETIVNELIFDAVNTVNKNHILMQASEISLARSSLKQDLISELQKRLAPNKWSVLHFLVSISSDFTHTYGIPLSPLEYLLEYQSPKWSGREYGFGDYLYGINDSNIKRYSWGKGFQEFLATPFEFDKYGIRIAFDKSIFKNISIFKSGLKGMRGMLYSSSLHMSGNVIGIDKLGHFFAQGLSYYREVFDYGRGLTEVLKMGLTDEKGSMGEGLLGVSMFGSGVVSYGDLAANIDGLSFWKKLFIGSSPYLKIDIQTQKILILKKFTFSDYKIAAWDEGVNLPEFSPSIKKQVKKNLNDMGIKLDNSLNIKKFINLLIEPCAELYLNPTLYTSQVLALNKFLSKDLFNKINKGFFAPCKIHFL